MASRNDQAAAIERDSGADFRDHLPTVDAAGRRVWLYPRQPAGRFHRARVVVSTLLLAVLVAAAPLVACSDDDSGLTVRGAWATASTGDDASVYLEIESSADDRLIAATVQPDIAARTELHQTVDGAMSQIAAIALPAGEQVELVPGGDHVMLLALDGSLDDGDTFDVTLVFESAAPVVVGVDVRDAD